MRVYIYIYNKHNLVRSIVYIMEYVRVSYTNRKEQILPRESQGLREHGEDTSRGGEARGQGRRGRGLGVLGLRFRGFVVWRFRVLGFMVWGFWV